MNRHLTALALGTATTLAGAGAAVAAPAAPTIGPVVVAWWSATNRTPAGPAVTPPDVGAKDLYITGTNALPTPTPLPLPVDAAGPAAIAGLRFQLPVGTTATHLQLQLGGTHPPAVTMTACRALRPFVAVYGGSWDDAPTYDCDQAGTARLTTDGQVVIDGVDRLRVGRELALVLVPGPLDRVVVAAPDAHVLALTGSSGSQVSAPPPLSPAAPVEPSGTAPLAGGGVPAGAAPGTLAPAGGPADATPPVLSSLATPAVASPARTAAAALPARPWQALLATLLLALLGFAFLVRPSSSVGVPAGTAGLRGVGRFRSERVGTVPDLA